MIVTLGTLDDFVAVKEVLGNPNAFFYRYIPSEPPSQPEQAILLALYDGGATFKSGTITTSVPTPQTISAAFPEAAELSNISVS